MTAADKSANLADKLAETLPPPTMPGNGTSEAKQPELPPQPVVSARSNFVESPAPQPVEHTIKVEAVQAKAPSRRKTAAQDEAVDSGGLPKTQAAQMNKLLPNAIKLRFRKRDETGETHYIRDYDAETLKATNHDVEAFIQKYLLPSHGEGRYIVQGLNHKGDVVREREYSVLNPQKALPVIPQQAGALPSEFFDRMWQRMEKLEEKAAQQQHQPDPLTQLQRMKEAFGGQTDPTSMMLMMQMINQPKSDPLSAELAAMKAEMQRVMQQAASPPPPLPPPPPPSDGITGRDLIEAMRGTKGPGVLEIISAVSGMMPAIKEIFGGNKSAEQEIQRLRDEMNNQRLQSLLDEIKDMKSKPARGIREVLDETQAVMQLAQQISAPSEPTFWSFLQTAAENMPETSQALSGLLDRVRQNEAQKAQQSQQRMQQAAHAVEEIKGAQTQQVIFPEGFDEACRRIEDAEDVAGRIEAVILSLQFLGKAPQYRPLVMRMLKHAKAGEEEELHKLMQSYLEDLVRFDMLSETAAADALACLEEYAPEVMAMLQGEQKQQAEDAEEPAEGDEDEPS